MNKGLECCQISFNYPTKGDYKKPVLNALSHCFKAGRQTLITGPTGSGKSTLLHLLAGLMRPTEGQILAEGKPISRWISHYVDLWRRNLGLVFQEPHSFSDLTTMENLAAPLVPLRLKRKKANRLIRDYLRLLNLAHLADQPAGLLSGGEHQRLTIARALIIRPRFILADEPTSFQDDDHTAAVLDLLSKERNRRACVVVCSHDDRLINSDDFDLILKLNQGRLEPT